MTQLADYGTSVGFDIRSESKKHVG